MRRLMGYYHDPATISISLIALPMWDRCELNVQFSAVELAVKITVAHEFLLNYESPLPGI